MCPVPVSRHFAFSVSCVSCMCVKAFCIWPEFAFGPVGLFGSEPAFGPSCVSGELKPAHSKPGFGIKQEFSF